MLVPCLMLPIPVVYLESVRADGADAGDAGALPDASHARVQLLAREYHLHLSRPSCILHTYILHTIDNIRTFN
jgi:hypothetical protein